MNVIKRDGREVSFDKNKIIRAITLAFENTYGKETDVISDEQVANKIATDLEKKCFDKTLSVEDIQDLIEQKLMASKFKEVAKEYILYRNTRTIERDKKSELIKKITNRVSATTVENSNANVDENSFSGREKEASTEIGKAMALDYGGLSKEVSDAHKEMLIYQHDLEKAIYGQHNCLFVDFQELFTNGFVTRNGDVRPPSTFSTACQLVAVAFQIQSQVQFGGCGSIHLDYDLAPFVKKSFYKHYKNGLIYIDGYTERDATKQVNFIQSRFSDKSINHDTIFTLNRKSYTYAMDMLEKEGRQSCEALFHNLNTLESRQGSQVPFTSINFGRDTSFEGRLATKWLLEASINGIGKHHLTSIFPISIFQYKDGVNAKVGDMNYDLKQLSLKSMSRRIYPNFVNCDWSQANEVEGDIDTSLATMGKCK